MPSLPPQERAASYSQATVVVTAPLDAAVLANGQSIEHNKTEQVFNTPDLDPARRN